MNANSQQIRDKFNELKGKAAELENQISKATKAKKKARTELHYCRKAHALVQKVAKQTQEKLRYQLGELPTLALSSVFNDPYEFAIDIEPRRNKTEVDFWFVRDGSKLVPKESSGLGSVDIAGMALRPALWSLRVPRYRDSIWLDEPFKHLKGEEANKRALAILAEICKPRPEQNWPGIQIVMIADERAPREDLLDVSDRVFEFYMKGRETKVRKLK